MGYDIGAGGKDTTRLKAAILLLKGAGLKFQNQVESFEKDGNHSFHIVYPNVWFGLGSEKAYYSGNGYKSWFNLDDSFGFHAFAASIVELGSPGIPVQWVLKKTDGSNSLRTAITDPKRKAITVGCAVVPLDQIKAMIKAIES